VDIHDVNGTEPAEESGIGPAGKITGRDIVILIGSSLVAGLVAVAVQEGLIRFASRAGTVK
jgi:tetrahydromethanopterin S-methyltransferase subunit G